jgi:(1->4)-alpha-D-glucan 1-alpha-D-glucosylmutase
VGADPTRFGIEPASVHQWLRYRQQRWPHALSATSTHDTKRGEEVRARLNVLSEIPGAWKTSVTKWRSLNRRFKKDLHGVPAPSANEEYFLYQTLVGMWPFEATPTDERLVRERLSAYAMKAMREAKVNTSWLSPDEAYEAAVLKFIESVLDRRRPNAFLDDFLPFQARVAELGIYNSLAQLLIKIAAPGVPDFYQGSELWDLNLVDPDNRRPVDYESRRRLLQSLVCDRRDRAQLAEELLERRADGRVKMFAAHRALSARAHERDLFEHGEYVPLQTSGALRESVFAFARRTAGAFALVAVPRLVASVVGDRGVPPLGSLWGDTRIVLPSGTPSSGTDALTGISIEVDRSDAQPSLAAADLFAHFPIALVVSR